MQALSPLAKDCLYSLIVLFILLPFYTAAPVFDDGSQPLQTLDGGTGCYYNFEHYYEGDRILTNEPCLNCTCHNRMLMCYLRVCPFTKAIGQDCTVEKKPDQCCPVITCPQVPVALLTSSTTQQPPSTTSLGRPDNYGCIINRNTFYADGAQVPSDPKKPCELCYCIRNHTACVMQECTLNVEGCKPVYQEGVCCPVRYDCDYEDSLTTQHPTTIGLITTPGGPTDCVHDGNIYHDGEMVTIDNKQPCEHCYCMRGDIVCAVQECGSPLEGSDCTPLEPPPGQCCPTSYQCANGTVPIKDTEQENLNKGSEDHNHDEASIEEISEEDRAKPNNNNNNEESSQTGSSEESKSNEHSLTQSPLGGEQDQGSANSATEHVYLDEKENPEITTSGKIIAADNEDEVNPIDSTQQPNKEEGENLESSPLPQVLSENKEADSISEEHLAVVTNEPELDTDIQENQDDKDIAIGGPEKVEEMSEKPSILDENETTENSITPSRETENDSQPNVEHSEDEQIPNKETFEGQNNPLVSNEIPEITTMEPLPASNVHSSAESVRVPGEGSCLVDGKTYPPDSDIPASPNSCHKLCKCVNSIVQCERIECSLPPSNYANCMPVQTPESCCPTYMCDQTPSDAPEIQNQLSIDKIDTNINEEGTMIEEIQPPTVSEKDDASAPGTHSNEEQTIPPVILGIPPENLVPGVDELPSSPIESEENSLGNTEHHDEDSSSSASDSSISEVNEANSIITESTSELPVHPPMVDEAAIHEGPIEDLDHQVKHPVKNSISDDQSQHHLITQEHQEGEPENLNGDKADDERENQPPIHDNEYVTPEINSFTTEKEILVDTGENQEENFSSQPSDSDNANDDTSTDVIEHSSLENTETVDPNKTENIEENVSASANVPTEYETQKTSEFQDSSETTHNPNHANNEQAIKAPISDHPLEETMKEQTNHKDIDSENEPEEHSLSSVQEHASITPTIITSTERGEHTDSFQGNDDSHHLHTSTEEIKVTEIIEPTESSTQFSTEEGYIPNREPGEVPINEVLHLENSDSETTNTEKYSTGTNIHMNNHEHHIHLPTVTDTIQDITTVSEISSVDTSEAIRIEDDHEHHDLDLVTDGHQIILEDSSEINSQSDSVDNEPSDKDPQGISDEVVTENSSNRYGSNETEEKTHINQHTTTGDHSETESTSEGILEVTEQTHLNNVSEDDSKINEAIVASTLSPLEYLSHAPTSSFPVTDGHFLEELTEQYPTVKPVVVEDIPSHIEEHGELLINEVSLGSPESIEDHSHGQVFADSIKNSQDSSTANSQENEKHQFTNSEIYSTTPGTNEESPELQQTGLDFHTPEGTHIGEVTHVELHEDKPTSLITSENHKISEQEDTDNMSQTTKVNELPDEAHSENDYITTENVAKPVLQEDSSPSETIYVNQSDKEGEMSEKPPDSENGGLEYHSETSSDIIDHNNELLSTGFSPSTEQVISEETSATDSSIEETSPEHSKESDKESTAQHIHLEDMSVPSHQSIPITPSPSAIQTTETIYQDHVGSFDEKQPDSEEITSHKPDDNNISTDSQTEVPESEENSSIIHHDLDGDSKGNEEKATFDPDIPNETLSENDINNIHLSQGAVLNNATSNDADENHTDASPIWDSKEETTSSKDPLSGLGNEMETNSEGSSLQVIQSNENQESTQPPSSDLLANEEHAYLNGEKDEINQQNVFHEDENENYSDKTTEIPLTTVSSINVDEVTPAEVVTSAETLHETFHEAEEHVSNKEEEEVKKDESVTDNYEDGQNINQENEDTKTEDLQFQEVTHSVITQSEEMPEVTTSHPNSGNYEMTSLSGVETSSSVIEGNQIKEGSSGVQDSNNSGQEVTEDEELPPEGQTELDPYDENSKEKPLIPEMSDHTYPTSSTVTGSILDNENVNIELGESNFPKIPSSDSQLLDNTKQTFEENIAASITEQYLEGHSGSNTENTYSTDSSSLLIESTKPEHTDVHGESSTPEDYIPTKDLEINQNSDEQVSTSTQSVLLSDVIEGSGQEESQSSGPPPLPINNEEQSQTEDSLETTTNYIVFSDSGSETISVNEVHGVHQEQETSDTTSSNDSEIHLDEVSETITPSNKDDKPVSFPTDKPISGENLETKPEEDEAKDNISSQNEITLTEEHSEVHEGAEKIHSFSGDTPGNVAETDYHYTNITSVTTADKLSQHEETHEGDTTPTPHPSDHFQTEHTLSHSEVHYNEGSSVGMQQHPNGPLFPNWTQKPYEHHSTSEAPHLPDDAHYPSGFEQDYEDDDGASYGPGTCRYGGKVYLSAQQIPRDDPCDFCFCFRSDIICLQQSCPPPIKGCYQETIKGFCCPRYECHVSMATMLNITTTTTTTTTTLPPHFFAHAYKGAAMKAGCQVKGVAYNVGDRIPSTSGPCLQCRCGANGQMKCEPTLCGPQEALLRQVMDAAAVSRR